MISIIVSTYKPFLYDQFCKNIRNTIGDVDYEIISIENNGLMGLCEAYNKGGEQAKFPYLCFCHEDILFRTPNWGQILIDLFSNNQNIGLVGCAGSIYKAWVPSGWSSPQISNLVKLNFIQTNPKIEKRIEYIAQNKGFDEVVSIDGCWMCTTKKIFNKIHFSSEYFTRYHCYDVDYSLSVGNQYKVVVSYDIIIEHLSVGNFSRDWVEETYRLHKKWGSSLPKYIGEISKKEIRNQESVALAYLSDKTLDTRFSLHPLLKVFFSVRLYSLIGFFSWCSLLKRTMVSSFYKYVFKR